MKTIYIAEYSHNILSGVKAVITKRSFRPSLEFFIAFTGDGSWAGQRLGGEGSRVRRKNNEEAGSRMEEREVL